MILTIALILFAQAGEYPWVEVSRDQQLTHYVDVLSLRSDGDRRYLRHRIDTATALASGTVTAEYEVEIDCEARTIALLEKTEWNASGEVVQSHRYSQPSSYPIEPNSVAQRFFELACGP